MSSIGDTSDSLDCSRNGWLTTRGHPKGHHHLGNKVGPEEDVSRSSQHGVGGGVLYLGSEEAVGREAGNSDIAELRFEVNDGHGHLRWEEGDHGCSSLSHQSANLVFSAV